MADLPFPARNLIYTDADRIKIFTKLKSKHLKTYRNEKPITYQNVKINSIDYTYGGYSTYLIYDAKDYNLYMLSDLFNDECRSMCTFGKHESPLDYYKKNKELIKEKLEQKKLQITPINLREEIYHNHKECSIHNPLIIRSVIEMFNAKNVLDMSSGWGDRLIGAMLSNINSYTGVDPNPCLHPHYEQIIKLFRSRSVNPKAEYTMINDGFQNITIDKSIFDLVYTSPPYFDYEQYSTDDNQSVSSVDTEDNWLEKFMYKAMIKCINGIEMGGHLVFYFSQERNKGYIEKWLRWCKDQQLLYYLGSIFFSDQFLKNLHPIFIFQKSEQVPKILYDESIDKIIIDKIIRDDLLIGGTAGRYVLPFIKFIIEQNPTIKSIVYHKKVENNQDIALAYSLNLLKVKIKLFIVVHNNLDKHYDLIKYLYPSASFDYPGPDAYEVLNINDYDKCKNILMDTLKDKVKILNSFDINVESVDDIILDAIKELNVLGKAGEKVTWRTMKK